MCHQFFLLVTIVGSDQNVRWEKMCLFCFRAKIARRKRRCTELCIIRKKNCISPVLSISNVSGIWRRRRRRRRRLRRRRFRLCTCRLSMISFLHLDLGFIILSLFTDSAVWFSGDAATTATESEFTELLAKLSSNPLVDTNSINGW